MTIELSGHTVAVPDHENFTILRSARWAGLCAPSSCENGVGATRMARVVEGTAQMRTNDVLTPEEVADGWVLTCQAVPTSPVVALVYE